jgi:HEAT repeat protein
MKETQINRVAAALIGARTRLQIALAFILIFTFAPAPASAQQTGSSPSTLTPLQLEIEKQRRRLNSSETEERRDAVMRLGAMKRPESSRVVASLGLRDSASIVRATSARAVLALPADEAAAALIPLLQDRDEFVRQETAYALGETRSRRGSSPLVALLEKEKRDGVRGAVAVALGQIGDEAAVIPLAELLDRRVAASGLLNRVRRKKRDENEFVRRAAAHSLGQIGSRAAVPALIDILEDERAPDDVRREAANSLGLIGDRAAVPALRASLTSNDPYLSRIAHDALLKINSEERPVNRTNQ